MKNLKRFLSIVLAVMMVFGTMSCLGSVIANASGYEHNNSNWDRAFNANDWDGIDSYEDLEAQYGPNKWMYVGIEIFEKDPSTGEFTVPTDHVVDPGDELLLKYYIKANGYGATQVIWIEFSRTFFDLVASSGATGTYVAANDYIGDMLDNKYSSNTGKKPSDLGGTINPDHPYNSTGSIGDLTCNTSILPPVQCALLRDKSAGVPNANSGISSAVGCQFDTLETTLQLAGAENYAQSLMTDEYAFSYVVKVRESTTMRGGVEVNDYFGVAPGAVGYIGLEENCSKFYNRNGKTSLTYGVETASGNQPVKSVKTDGTGVENPVVGTCNIFHTEDCNHTFIIGGGDEPTATFMNGSETISTVSGTSVTAPAAPVSTSVDLEFDGWSSDNGATKYAAGATITLTEDTTFYAQWRPVAPTTYTLKYFDGDTEYTDLRQENVLGNTALAAAPTKAGFRFDGWSDGTSTYPAGTSINVVTNKNFTAVWTPLYTATFTGDGIETTSALYEAGETIVFPNPGTREGYNPVWTPNYQTMPAEDTTFTLSWVGQSKTITFDTKGGTTVASITAPAGSTISWPENPTKEGYTFGGWFTDPDCTAGNEFAPTTIMPTTNVNLWAKWIANTHTVTYENYDGTVLYGPISVPFGEPIPDYVGATPEKTGNRFTGWKDSDNKTPVDYGTMPNKDLVFKAQFTPNQYTITFKKANGSVIADGTGTYYYGETITVPNAGLAAGETLTGWTASVGANLPADATTITCPAADTVYTASTGTVTYYVQYVLDGENYGDPVPYPYDARIVDPEVTNLDTGRKFDGWESHASTVTGNMTINGTTSWIEYTITYRADGAAPYATFTRHYGEAFPVPADNPTKPGYRFEGWDNDAEIVTGPADIYGIFNALGYELTFVYGLDGSDEADGGTVYYGDTLAAEDFPDDDAAIAGYGLTWTYNGAAISAPWDIPALAENSTITITAEYGAETHKIIFKIVRANGVTETIYQDSGEVGESVLAEVLNYVIPDSAKNNGYDYSDWDTAIPTTFQAADVTITSTETAHVYTDTWYDKDGSELYSEQVAFKAAIPTKVVPEYDGYENFRWTGLSPDGKQEAKDMNFAWAADAKEVDYKVTFRMENVDGTYTDNTSTKQAYTDSEVKFSASDLNKTGYDYIEADSTPTAIVNGDGSTKIIAVFNLKRFTVYVTDDDNTYTVPYKYGQAIVNPTPAGKTGYSVDANSDSSFKWSRTANGAAITKPETATQDYYVTVLYTVNTWNLIPVVDGTEGTAVRVNYGDALVEFAPVTQTGYTFNGWYSDPDCTIDFDWTQTMPDNNVKAYGKLEAVTYVYTFVSEGKSEDVTGTIGQAVNAPTPGEKEGAAFKKWSPNVPAKFEGTEYTRTFTAQYEGSSYKINYIVDGETVKSYDVAYGTAKTDIEANYKPANPTKTGYVFNGWTGIPDTMPAEDVDVIADFTEGKFNATFYERKSSTNVIATITNVTFNTTFMAPPALPKTDIEQFVCWVDSNGTEYAAKADITMSAEGMTFYAKWEPRPDVGHIESAGRVSEGYYQRGPADYSIVLKEGVVADAIILKYTNEYGQPITNTFTKASIILDGDEGFSITNLGGNGGKETWNLNLSLAAADDYKLIVKGKANGTAFEDTTAYPMTVYYDTKTEEVIESEFISAEISNAAILRGNEATWTVTTSTSVTWLEFVGQYTSAAGTTKTLTTYYKSSNYMDAESGVTVSDSNGVRTWVIPMKFTYTVSDAKIVENYNIYYKVSGSDTFDLGVAFATPIVVARTTQALAPETEGYDKFDLVSVSTDKDAAAVGDKVTFTIVTTDDVTKVRIGFAYTADGAAKTKTATYQETSSNVTGFEKADGLITWTVSYKVPATAVGDTTFNVQCRGLEWGETKTAEIEVA